MNLNFSKSAVWSQNTIQENSGIGTGVFPVFKILPFILELDLTDECLFTENKSHFYLRGTIYEVD